jgi:hypothetical protein
MLNPEDGVDIHLRSISSPTTRLDGITIQTTVKGTSKNICIVFKLVGDYVCFDNLSAESLV